MLARLNFSSSIADAECSMRKSALYLTDKMRMLGPAYFFQCVSYDIADSGDLFRLSDPVHAVKGLILDHGVPLRLHEKDVVCSR